MGKLLKCRNPDCGTDLLIQYPQGLGIRIHMAMVLRICFLKDYGSLICTQKLMYIHPITY